jgi:hypothetical protein
MTHRRAREKPSRYQTMTFRFMVLTPICKKSPIITSQSPSNCSKYCIVGGRKIERTVQVCKDKYDQSGSPRLGCRFAQLQMGSEIGSATNQIHHIYGALVWGKAVLAQPHLGISQPGNSIYPGRLRGNRQFPPRSLPMSV